MEQFASRNSNATSFSLKNMNDNHISGASRSLVNLRELSIEKKDN